MEKQYRFNILLFTLPCNTRRFKFSIAADYFRWTYTDFHFLFLLIDIDIMMMLGFTFWYLMNFRLAVRWRSRAMRYRSYYWCRPIICHAFMSKQALRPTYYFMRIYAGFLLASFAATIRRPHVISARAATIPGALAKECSFHLYLGHCYHMQVLYDIYFRFWGYDIFDIWASDVFDRLGHFTAMPEFFYFRAIYWYRCRTAHSYFRFSFLCMKFTHRHATPRWWMMMIYLLLQQRMFSLRIAKAIHSRCAKSRKAFLSICLSAKHI